MITVAIVNASTVLTDAQLAPIVAALQIQVTRDFAPVWGVDAHLVHVPVKGTPPAGSWLLLVQDHADQPGALGYHQTQLGLPWGIIGAADDLAAGADPGVTISHELLEMLADPYVQSVVVIDTQMGGFRGGISAVIAQEVSDACEADGFGYKIAVGAAGQPTVSVLVSDFVFPWWFGGEVPAKFAGVYSFTGACKSPFAISAHGQVTGLLHGGYIGIRQFRQAGGWTTVNAAHSPAFEAFQATIDAMLPGGKAHTLQHDGTTQADPPKFSRRARVLERLNA